MDWKYGTGHGGSPELLQAGTGREKEKLWSIPCPRRSIRVHTVGAEESFGIAVVEKWTRANRRADRRGGRRGSNREHMQICIGYAEEDLMRSFSRLRECERGRA